MRTQDVVVAGGGIGGLAAAIAAGRAGHRVQVLEQAPAFGEVGAGVQLGPNATGLLREWPTAWREMQSHAATPQSLRVSDANSGAVLGGMALGSAMAGRYGAPYLTVHRADVHAALLAQVREQDAQVHTSARVTALRETSDGVRVETESGAAFAAAAVVGADGLWSRVRELLLADGPPIFTGHLAYRSLLRQADLPQALRSHDVNVWLAGRMHAVAYPVRGGEWLNVVCLIEGQAPADPRSWDSGAVAGALQQATSGCCAALRDLLAAAPQWRLWALHARAPVGSPLQLARGRVALLGDAAHPMLPYLAQGAGMAIEDAAVLQQVLAGRDVARGLQQYAQSRWRRCARVQARSRRNATIFHAEGLLRTARDVAMRVVGEPLLDVPWLYRGP